MTLFGSKRERLGREDGSYVCTTLPAKAFTNIDLFIGALRPWAHGPTTG